MASTYQEALMRLAGMPERQIQKLENLRKEGEWLHLAISMTLDWQTLAVTFAAYFDEVPKEYRRDFLIELFMNHGDTIPAIRSQVKKIRKYGEPVLPLELEGQNPIVVYRAGSEPLDRAAYRMSWTIDRKVAEHFIVYSGLRFMSDMHLYRGTIAREKILANTNGREEKEIIQYHGVRNIEDLGMMTYSEIIETSFGRREKGNYDDPLPLHSANSILATV